MTAVSERTYWVGLLTHAFPVPMSIICMLESSLGMDG